MNVFEKTLSYIENRGKIAVDKLIARPETLTTDDTATLLTYLDLQRIRVPRQAKMAREMLKVLIHYIASQDQKIAGHLNSKSIKIEIDNKKARFKYMKAASGVHMPYFAKMD